MKPSPFSYTTAMVRGLPKSFSSAIQMLQEPIDVDVALLQHEKYNDLIRELVPKVVEVETDDSMPDCVFIEDTAVVVGSVAAISRPGALSRRGEIAPVQAAMANVPEITTCIELQAPATLDGGDVMLAGGVLWVGLSSRSNEEAVQQLQAIFSPKTPVIGFPLPEGNTLHLKSVMSAFDEHRIIVADNDTGRQIVKQAEAHPLLAGKWEYVYVPDAVASNILRIGQHVVMQEALSLEPQLDQTRRSTISAPFSTHPGTISAPNLLCCLPLGSTTDLKTNTLGPFAPFQP
eukprot:gene6746-3419_t